MSSIVNHKAFAYTALIIGMGIAILLIEHRNDERLRKFQVAKCHTDNTTRVNQRIILTDFGKLMVLFGDRAKVGLKPIPFKLIHDVENALKKLPNPDIDCDGVPDE